MSKTFWLTTLGCPKNQVDSDKLTTRLLGEGLTPASDVEVADVVVVNTCAFIDAAREESIETILDLAQLKQSKAELVVTGCLAERYGSELASELPEVDLVAGFGVDFVTGLSREARLGFSIPRRSRKQDLTVGGIGFSGLSELTLPAMDLLNLQRGQASRPWAYLKVAEGCNKKCGFCAIPSFRGKQVSRSIESVLEEASELSAQEVVVVAQDLASYGSDLYGKPKIVELFRALSNQVPWVRLLYLYPSELTQELIEAIASSPVPYFDLSLQHVSRDHLKRMRRFGYGELFLKKIATIRNLAPEAVFRSNFILGYPGETEQDHLELVDFILQSELDWVGFFTYSMEDGTYGARLDNQVPRSLALERLNEVSDIQEGITRRRRAALVGKEIEVLIDSPGVARSFMEAPEIDGVVSVSKKLRVGEFHTLRVSESNGPDISGRSPVVR